MGNFAKAAVQFFSVDIGGQFPTFTKVTADKPVFLWRQIPIVREVRGRFIFNQCFDDKVNFL